LYYIAFFKNGAHLWGDVGDKCNTQSVGTRPVVSNGCSDEVSIQLITILAVNMFVGQTQEVAIPWLLSKLKLYLQVRNNEEITVKDVPIWERANKLAAFPGTLDEYSEIVIQYGYLTIFAATFPLAPLLAVLNNMIEIRTDAFKLLTSFTRPQYKGAQNIGTWFQILEVLGVIAVLTNCALIGLGFEVILDLVYTNPDAFWQGAFRALGIVVFMEHVIFFLKYIISFLVPDYPGWITKKMALEDWIKEESFKNIRKKTHKKHVWESGNHEDDEVGDEIVEAMGEESKPVEDKGKEDLNLVVE